MPRTVEGPPAAPTGTAAHFESYVPDPTHERARPGAVVDPEGSDPAEDTVLDRHDRGAPCPFGEV